MLKKHCVSRMRTLNLDLEAQNCASDDEPELSAPGSLDLQKAEE